jgi:hypothetical protein
VPTSYLTAQDSRSHPPEPNPANPSARRRGGGTDRMPGVVGLADHLGRHLVLDRTHGASHWVHSSANRPW